MKHLPSPHRIFLLPCLALVLSAFTTPASAVVTLPDLAPGSEYQLIFVTSGTITATSPDINVYNSFVISQAALNPSLPSASWSAVVSTPTVNAIDNAPTYSNIPIYNTQGQLVATGSTGFWSGTTLNAIAYDQNGTPASANAYTGSNDQGDAFGDSMGQSLVTVGAPHYVNLWLDEGGYIPPTYSLPVYALSSPITISAVPEPKTWAALLGVGATGGVGFAWYWWRRTRPQWRVAAEEHQSYFED